MRAGMAAGESETNEAFDLDSSRKSSAHQSNYGFGQF